MTCSPWKLITLAALPVSILFSSLVEATPVPTYGTFFNGPSGVTTAIAVATDNTGNVIMVGSTTSPQLPGTADTFQPSKAAGFPDNEDAFIAKFDPTGETLLWASFLGGDGNDVPVDVAVDSTGDIYVTGTTSSSNFSRDHLVQCSPATGFLNFNSSPAFTQDCSMSTPLQGAAPQSFVSKISSDGGRLLYSVGISSMNSTALAVGRNGDAYVASTGPGVTQCLFLFRISPSGDRLVYGALLGGGDIAFLAQITALAVDSDENCYAVGAASINIPTTGNALQHSNSNADLNPNLGNAFILMIDPTGTHLQYGTWFGERYHGTIITSIALGEDSLVHFAGASSGMPSSATPGAYQSAPGGGFVGSLRLGAATLDAFSYLPSQTPLSCASGPSAGGIYCGHVVMTVDSKAEDAYLLYRASQPDRSTEVLSLKLPKFDGTSPSPASDIKAQTGFTPSDMGWAESSSLWIVGRCMVCQLDNLISPDAFQSQDQGTGSAVLLRLEDISPTISHIGSSANGSTPLAAGEIVSIYGTQLGPSIGSGTLVDQDGTVTTSNSGSEVYFDGIRAPILYASANQINAAVPCMVNGRSSTEVRVQYREASSAPVEASLSTAAPGIFSLDGSGKGQAVALNSDYSLNSASNPVARGSILIFYATGIGVTSPCTDGHTYRKDFPTPTLPIVVGVGNVGVPILYAGQAPYFISGIAQINVAVPDDVPTGSVPLTIRVGDNFSQTGLTVEVK